MIYPLTSAPGGPRLCAQALGQGLVEGGKGFFIKPVEGAMDNGAKGFVKGLGKGALGLLAKPISGVATLASKTAEGIASDAKSLVGGRARMQLRVRQPRVIGPDTVLHPYPRTPPLGAQQQAGAPPHAEDEEEEPHEEAAAPGERGSTSRADEELGAVARHLRAF